MSEIAVETTEAQAPPQESPATEELSFDERIEAAVAKVEEKLGKRESAPEDGAPEEEPVETTEAPEGSPEAEAAPKEEPKPETAPAKIEVSPEEIADTKYWGSLDKAGWERMERDYPKETASYKAAITAGSRAVQAARAEAQEILRAARAGAPNSEQTGKPTSTSFDEAFERSQSLDPDEAKAGFMDAVKIFVRENVLPEAGVDPVEGQAKAVASSAYEQAIAEVPELSELQDSKELDAAVDGDPGLLELLEIASKSEPEAAVRLTKRVMVTAARTVLANRATKAKEAEAAKAAKEDEAKKVEDAKQKRLRENQQNPSQAALKTQTGAAPRKAMSVEEVVDKHATAWERTRAAS
jgi:hypothetical protein